jgi:adenylylsulfate kinase
MGHHENIIPHSHAIGVEQRIEKNGHRPKLIWFTGLSGSGKSTLANALEVFLHNQGLNTYILDGDNVRSRLNSDLDFSAASRTENIRRISEVGALFVDAGIIVITAFISPFAKDRAFAKECVGEENFLEVYVKCSLEECERRDVKGLYAKARRGEIKDFTGISSPFEEPIDPDVIVDTEDLTTEEALKIIKDKVLPKLK